MGLPIRSSKDSKRVAKAAEEEPPTSIDQCLVDAVLHPQFRKKLLSIEAKIQQVLRNPNLEKVEFPECHTFHLKSLADKLAHHYRLESRCKEHIAFARKTPDSKIPSITLSGIPELNRKDKLPILVKRSNDASSSSTTLSLPELTDPVKREEEYYKAREQIFNELGPASSTAPLVSSSTPPVASSSILPVVSSFRSPEVSRSTSPIHSRIGEEVDQDMASSSILPVVSSSRFLAVSTPPNSEIGKEVDQYDGLSDMHATTNLVNNPGANMASKSIVPVVSSSSSLAVSRSTSLIHNGIGEEVDQDDGFSDMHAATNPVNNHGLNMVSSSILPVVSSSRSLPVSRTTSPIHSGIGTEVDQDGLNDMNAATNPVHNPGVSMASNFRSLSVSRSASPIYSEIGKEVDQDGLSDMPTATNPVNIPGENMNHNPTNSMYGRGTGVFNPVPTTGQQPLPMQNAAITYQHQAVQFEPIIQQPEMYQYVSRIQVPITGQQPLPMQNAAITSQHVAVQHDPRIQQPQMYQYVSSIQQPQTGQQPLPMQNAAITSQHVAVQHEPRIQQPQMYQYVSSIQQPQTSQQSLPMQNAAITSQHVAVQHEPRIQQPQMYQYVSSIQQPQTGQQPLPMQNAAITSQHQAVQHEPRIQQPQMYQYVSSIQQPQMMQYEVSTAQPYIHTPYYNNYHYDASSGLYNPAYPSYPQWPWLQPMQTFSQQPTYPYGVSTSPYASSAPQLVLVQPVQLFHQEPMQYRPGTAQQPSNSFIQNNRGAVRPRRARYGRGHAGRIPLYF